MDHGIALLNSGASGTMKYNSFSNLLENCRYAANYVKDKVDRKFNKILDKVDSMDTKADGFITQFQSTIIPPLRMLIEKLKIDAVTVPANVKICVQAYLNLVPLFENSDTIVDQLHLGLAIKMVSFGHLKQTRITEIINKTFSYTFDGWLNVRKLGDSDPTVKKYISKLYQKCTDSTDAMINEAKLFFDEIFKKSDEIRAEILNENNKEVFTGDSDHISDKTKALLDYYSNRFELKIIPDIEEGFKLLKYLKKSVPLEMKVCVDKILIAMQSSQWCAFTYFMNLVLNNNIEML